MKKSCSLNVKKLFFRIEVPTHRYIQLLMCNAITFRMYDYPYIHRRGTR